MSYPDTRPVSADRQLDLRDADLDARIQPWFATMLASIVPALVSFSLHESFRIALFVLAGLLFVAGCIMLYREDSSSK